MEDQQERRKFLGRLGLGISSILALPLIGNSRGKTELLKTEELNSTKMEKHPVTKVRALGFQWETLDPFLFCVHHEDKYPKGNAVMGPDASLSGRHIGQDFIVKDGWRMYHGDTVPGFPGHPHRGFETITVVREGMVDHCDSTGAAGRYGDGDVQWMTAGRGVQHSEMFPLIHADKENPMELFQIWLNLPKKSKMVEPHFKMLWGESIPIIESVGPNAEKTTIEIIAGRLNETGAPVPPPDSWANVDENHVGVFNIHLEPGATFVLEKTEEGINRTLFYYEGDGLKINELIIPHYHAADVESHKDLVIQNGDQIGKILVLQGRPINEPVVQHGPFVMNTRDEIKEAFEEYHATQFGGWPWPKYDYVHDRKKGRFALHSDGTEELKS